jgi:FlaA1/EpsC-like NDP-sugar epimerase
MKIFLAVYLGSAEAFEKYKAMDEEMRKTNDRSGMDAWMKWTTDHKGSIVEMGSPLGKTKRITEIIVDEFNKYSAMKCCSVRFGNVFASRGSVIETFVHQINHNLDVTLTDIKATRFFMSHDEAANLILASAIFNDQGIFVQNMGEEIEVSQIVHRLAIHLGKKYRQKIIGLQTGEKLNEELYAGEFTKTSINEIVKVTVPKNREITAKIEEKSIPKSNIETLQVIDELIDLIENK